MNKKSAKIITVICCLLVQLCAGILYLWSVFNENVQSQFNFLESSASLVGSLMIFGFVLGNLIGGIVQDKTNPKVSAFIGCVLFGGGILLTSLLTQSTVKLIYLTYSGLAGIGCGFAYGSVLKCLQKWFPLRRGFASGLSVSAFGLSTVVFAPLIKILLSNHQVTFVFGILGIVFLGVMLPACFLIRLPLNSDNVANNSASGLTPLQAMKKGAFWCIFFSSFFINATWNILMPLIQPLAQDRGLKGVWITAAVMVTGITNATGRIGVASISDKLKRSSIMIAMALMTFSCAIMLIWASGFGYIILIALIALAYGGPSATMPAMNVDVGGTKYSGTNYGIILISLGLSSIIFGPLSAALKDKTGSMTASLVMAAATCLVPIILMLVYNKLTKPLSLDANNACPKRT